MYFYRKKILDRKKTFIQKYAKNPHKTSSFWNALVLVSSLLLSSLYWIWLFAFGLYSGVYLILCCIVVNRRHKEPLKLFKTIQFSMKRNSKKKHNTTLIIWTPINLKKIISNVFFGDFVYHCWFERIISIWGLINYIATTVHWMFWWSRLLTTSVHSNISVFVYELIRKMSYIHAHMLQIQQILPVNCCTT